MTNVGNAAVTKVGFGVTSILGYAITVISAAIPAVQALEGANLSFDNPLVLVSVIAGAVTTFVRGLQAAAKAHANNPGL